MRLTYKFYASNKYRNQDDLNRCDDLKKSVRRTTHKFDANLTRILIRFSIFETVIMNVLPLLLRVSIMF